MCVIRLCSCSMPAFNLFSGNTALHDAAESGSLNSMILLIVHGAKMAKDCYGMTPLLAAAVTGHTNVVEFLIRREECTKMERIDALELLGATYIDKKRDLVEGLQYWKRAMYERMKDPKNIIWKPVTEERKAAYDYKSEVSSFQELQQLISDPDDTRMQALLVRERILGPTHPDTSYYIRYRGAVYADLGDFDRCIILWMYATDMQQANLDPLNLMTQSSFLSFAELFSFMYGDCRNRKPYDINTNDVLAVCTKAVTEVERSIKYLQEGERVKRDYQNFDRLLVIMMHLLSLVCKHLEKCSEQDGFAIKRQVYRMVQFEPRCEDAKSLLHLSASKETSTVGKYPVCRFPSAPVARLLIEVGASTNAVDQKGNTPLHTAASNPTCNKEVMRVLLQHKAHLDATNNDGKTAEELLRDIIMIDVACPVTYTSLQCLAAKVIVGHGIEYIGRVSPKLQEFIGWH